jgi:hypothetical protein
MFMHHQVEYATQRLLDAEYEFELDQGLMDVDQMMELVTSAWEPVPVLYEERDADVTDIPTVALPSRCDEPWCHCKKTVVCDECGFMMSLNCRGCCAHECPANGLPDPHEHEHAEYYRNNICWECFDINREPGCICHERD